VGEKKSLSTHNGGGVALLARRAATEVGKEEREREKNPLAGERKGLSRKIEARRE